ncbi:MAG: membrane protein insertase YidC [Thermoleophilia bacterium]
MITALLTFASALSPILSPIETVFEPFVKLLHWILVELHSVLGIWGLAIIALTIIVRLILVPLTFKQFRSAQAMAALQPHIKELQRKYKGDKQKLQQETMRLYQANKVNPFASCLPMLLQIPVFISLYWAIKGTHYLTGPTTAALANSSFLWLKALGKPDPTYILLIIYVVSQLVSTELMMTPQTDKQQKWIMRAMPVFFIVILRSFPSGLFLYWVTTNLWTIGQQLIIRHQMPHEVAVANVKLPTAGGDGANDSVPAKPQGRFMRAIMAAQEDRDRKSPASTKAGSRPMGKTGAKTAARPAGKSGTKPTGKPGTKPAARPAGKAGARPTAKPVGKTEAKPNAKPAGRPGAKVAGAKPAAKPANQAAGGAKSSSNDKPTTNPPAGSST